MFFLLETANRLPPVAGLDTAWGVCAFQTLTWLHHWIYFLAIDLRRSDYTLGRVSPAFKIDMETSTRGADNADELSEYDAQLWSSGCEQSPCVYVPENLPYVRAMGWTERTKCKCLTAASAFDSLCRQEINHITFIHSPSMLLCWSFSYSSVNDRSSHSLAIETVTSVLVCKKQNKTKLWFMSIMVPHSVFLRKSLQQVYFQRRLIQCFSLLFSQWLECTHTWNWLIFRVRAHSAVCSLTFGRRRLPGNCRNATFFLCFWFWCRDKTRMYR